MQCNVTNDQLTIGDDRYIHGFKKLAEIVHKYGGKIVIHMQPFSGEIKDGNRRQVGPSAVVAPARVIGVRGERLHELTPDEIRERIQWFASAA